MDLGLLKAGHRIGLDDGSEAMVLNETLDGDWIRIRYLSSEDDESLVGTEDLVSSEEVKALLGVARTGEWGGEVGVTLLLESGSEGYPRLYRATTMSGIPYGVVVSGESEESGEAALFIEVPHATSHGRVHTPNLPVPNSTKFGQLEMP